MDRRQDLPAVMGDDHPLSAAFHPYVRAAKLDISNTFDLGSVSHYGDIAKDTDLVIVSPNEIGIWCE